MLCLRSLIFADTRLKLIFSLFLGTLFFDAWDAQNITIPNNNATMLSLEVVDAAASINEASIESTLNGGFNLNGTELCYEADTWSQSFAVFRVKKYLWIHHLRLLHPGTEDGR